MRKHTCFLALGVPLGGLPRLQPAVHKSAFAEIVFEVLLGGHTNLHGDCPLKSLCQLLDVGLYQLLELFGCHRHWFLRRSLRLNSHASVVINSIMAMAKNNCFIVLCIKKFCMFAVRVGI